MTSLITVTDSCQEVLGAQAQIPALDTWSRNREGHQRSPWEPGVVHAFNPEASRPPGVQGQHGLQSKFQASIMRPQKQTNKNSPPQQINKTQSNTHMYTCTCTCTYVHTQCTHSHVRTHACTHMCSGVHMHACMHTHMHAHICTHMHKITSMKTFDLDEETQSLKRLCDSDSPKVS